MLQTKEITANPETVALPSRWADAVIYQIYPRSFQEKRPAGTPDHGEGSLAGVTERLDYIQSLGVDAIWLTPFYQSPMVDGGYDVADHRSVDPRYGTLADFDNLLEQAHQRELLVMLDFVPNHVSDQHPWFQDFLAKGRASAYHDWFFTMPGRREDGPPNNWASVFSGDQLKAWQAGELSVDDDKPIPYRSFWDYYDQLGAWVGHDFARQQPSLDWSNPAVRQAQLDVLRFWLDRGVDGFRVDAVNHIGKDLSLADDPPCTSYDRTKDNPADQLRRTHSANYRPTLKAYLRDMIAVLHESAYAARDLHLVFEAYSDDSIIKMINGLDPAKANAFNFGRMLAQWQAHDQGTLIGRYYRGLPRGAIANNVNGNHDQPRLASRLGDKAARAATLLNFALPGQTYIFNGEEAGLHNVDIPAAQRDDKLDFRDEARTPMPWTAGKNAGFSKAAKSKLWLPLDPDYRQHNIQRQLSDQRSPLWLTKQLADLRRQYPRLMRYGRPYILRDDNPDILALAVRDRHEQVVVLINFAKHHEQVKLAGAEQIIGRLLVSSLDNQAQAGREVALDRTIHLQGEEAIAIGA